VPLGLEELQAQSCKARRGQCAARGEEGRESERDAQVKTGDSMSWTSLSIWMSIGTVISRSALQNEGERVSLGRSGRMRGRASEHAQNLQESARLLVRLGEEAQRKGGDGVVRPRAVERDEEVLAVLRTVETRRVSSAASRWRATTGYDRERERGAPWSRACVGACGTRSARAR